MINCKYSHLAVAQLVEDVDQPGVGEAGGNVSCTKHPALGSGNLSLRLSPFNASYLQKVDLRCELASPKNYNESTGSSTHLDSSPKPDGTWYQLSPGQCCKSVGRHQDWNVSEVAPVGVKLKLEPRASQPHLAHPLHSNHP